jgi:four helix bundle protein
MQNPANLRVTAQALKVARLTYVATGSFPESERFGLAAQMRRAAVSIGSNIAEGCGREQNRSLKPFLHHALGSVNELQFQLTVTQALGLGDASTLEPLSREVGATRGMLLRLLTRMQTCAAPAARRTGG